MWGLSDESLEQILKAVERMMEGEYETRVSRPLKGDFERLAELLERFGSRIHSDTQDLTREKSRLSAVLSNMTEGVVAVDLKGQILVVNPSLCHLFGINSWEAKGKPFLEVIRENSLNSLIQSVLQDSKSRTSEVQAQGKVLEAIAVPLIEEGLFRGVLLVLHDITSLRRMEQVRRDFVANVSHELRTPLASIKGMAETLRAGALDDVKVRGEFVESIEKQADSLIALVEDLLSLAAIESGHRAPQKKEVAFPALIKEVIQSLLPLAKKKNVVFHQEIPDGLPPFMADPEQFKQVLQNLCENAVKFNKDSGDVRVKAEVRKEGMAVSIQDSGAGIPAQDLSRIFERFYRVDKARSRDMGGTGLGLSIVKHIVDAHGGTIHVESLPNKGTLFTVLFPR